MPKNAPGSTGSKEVLQLPGKNLLPLDRKVP
jgi:hypothetical protein